MMKKDQLFGIYFIYLLIQIGLSLILLFLLLIHKKSFWINFLEHLILLVTIIDIFYRYKYWNKLNSKFFYKIELIILVVLIFIMSLEYIYGTTVKDEEIELILIILRYVIQSIRLYLIFKRIRKGIQNMNSNKLKINDISYENFMRIQLSSDNKIKE